MNTILLCPAIQFTLCSICLILHLIVLPTNHWAIFTARTELGLPEEFGRYGFWGLCSVKAPLYRDDCDPLDTFFRPPHHMLFAGVVAAIQAVILGLFLPFAAIRLQQIRRNKPNFLLNVKTVNTIKLSLVVIASLLVGLTLLLTTLRETISREQIIFHSTTLDNYHIWKGWAFWLELAVTLIDIIIVILCLIEMNKLKELEALGFTTFIANPSPHSMSRLNTTSEYFNPHFQSNSHLNPEPNSISTISYQTNDGWVGCESQNCQLYSKHLPFHTISFNNPAFLNHSPDLKRSKPLNGFEFI